MSLFSKKDTPDSNPLKNYDKQYDIYHHKDILDALEAEMEPYGDFYQLCQAKGWISIKKRPNDSTFDFTVHPDHAQEFADYVKRDLARRRRLDYQPKKLL